MASSSSSSAPVFSPKSWNYDVFLSFRGEDVRKTFVDHLYAALDQKGINTYKDDVTLPRGESISPALLKAIEQSQIAVIIFSKNYANSSWCLDELTHVMKCRDRRRQIVMPIFYDVKPTEVRKQKGKYKEAFDKHEPKNKIKSWGQAVVNDPRGWLSTLQKQNRKYREVAAKHELENKAKVESWRQALMEASNISGWETKHIANGHESQGIKQIVDEISQSLNHRVTSQANENLIGILTRVQGLKSDLQTESNGVRVIGIWGIGGGGKTTLATSIYDEISSMYDGCCFVKNIREESSKNGLESLQVKILSSILKQKQVQEVRMARLCHKKVLIVLDDVDQLDQLKTLVGSYDWFGNGSRIIITTRDEHVLKAHRVDVIHHITLLNHDEALKLFHKHAHRDYTPMEDFEKLSKEVVSYAGGLPLALTVLGCFLCDKNISQWRSALSRLKEIPDKDIIGKLKISFDGLEEVEKMLFLDVACFFRRMHKSQAMELLNACGLHPVIGVEVLRQKALIVITEDGEFDMHDLVQEMGHYIVSGEHPRNPEKHNRVWKRKDVSKILAMDAMTKLDNIEAIDLRYVTYEESQHFLQAAANMNKLRWIHLSADEPYLRNSEQNYIVPLPLDFPPSQLSYLYIRGSISQQQLWEGYKFLPNLTHMELHHLHNLIKTPDFAGLPDLETFKLGKCQSLEEIHPSIGRLKGLVFVSIWLCPRLRIFPTITRIKKLETLEFPCCEKLEIISDIQQEMGNLPHLHGKEVASYKESCTSGYSSRLGVECCLPHNINHRRLLFLHSALRKLDLSWCSLGDEEIGSNFWELPNLEELNLSENSFSRLDFSIVRLPRLKWLNVSSCKGLVELSELPSSIAVVRAEGCRSLESFRDISNCKWLWKVSLWGENKIDQLHGDTLIRSMLQGNAIEDHFISLALQHQFPIRLRVFRRNTFRLHLPNHWYNDFCGFMIYIVTDASFPEINIIIEHEDPPFDLSQESDEVLRDMISGYYQSVTCIGYVSFSSLRHTTLLTSSYNIISFTIQDMISGVFDGESTYVGSELVPRKSKRDQVQTKDCSEFGDKNLKTFTIQQCDSESSVKISWKPCYRNW